MSDKIKINSWDELQPLEVVAVGSTYDSSFFDGVKNKKIGDVLKKVVDETNEDIEYFKSKMQSHGIQVLHASPKELGYKDSILDYVDVNGKLGYDTQRNIVKKNLIPTSPLQIRDDSIIMGNKLLITDKTFEVQGYVKKFVEWFGEEQVDLSIYKGDYQFNRTHINLKSQALDEGKDENFYIDNPTEGVNSLAGFCSPNLTRLGKTCIVDLWQTEDILDVLKEKFPMFNYKSLKIGGHLDSVFSVLKPGYVIAGPWFKGNENIFNNWKVVYFEDSKWDKVAAFFELRDKNRGAWWVPGEEHNDQFTEFVNAFLPNWTGYCEETIFDLNCLIVDDKHVVINAENPELIKVLKELDLEPIVCPLRNRFFWDGGWHCLTLDIRRRGGQVDYGV